MKKVSVICFLSFLLSSCYREVIPIPSIGQTEKPLKAGSYVEYIIPKGEQYCDKNFYEPVNYQVQQFSVLFDSTAVYKTLSGENQYDINKLYGFSDGEQEHHMNSARIGWRWSDNALRLFAYVYNDGKLVSQEIKSIAIGVEISCSISVNRGAYQFNVNGTTVSLPRTSSTVTGQGYKLYPYFGGDERAPHDIHIFIRELS